MKKPQDFVLRFLMSPAAMEKTTERIPSANARECVLVLNKMPERTVSAA